MKTTKQIADGLGVSKQQVYRYIKRHNIKEARQENGVMYYNETAENLITQGFSQKTTSSEAEQKHINDTAIEAVISMLQKELDAKNKQIADQAEQLKAKDEQIKNLTSSIDNLTTSLRAEQALHGGTMKQLVAPEEPAEADIVIGDEAQHFDEERARAEVGVNDLQAQLDRLATAGYRERRKILKNLKKQHKNKE